MAVKKKEKAIDRDGERKRLGLACANYVQQLLRDMGLEWPSLRYLLLGLKPEELRNNQFRFDPQGFIIAEYAPTEDDFSMVEKHIALEPSVALFPHKIDVIQRGQFDHSIWDKIELISFDMQMARKWCGRSPLKTDDDYYRHL